MFVSDPMKFNMANKPRHMNTSLVSSVSSSFFTKQHTRQQDRRDEPTRISCQKSRCRSKCQLHKLINRHIITHLCHHILQLWPAEKRHETHHLRTMSALERTVRLGTAGGCARGLVPPRQLRETDTSLYGWANLSLQPGFWGKERPWASQYAGCQHSNGRHGWGRPVDAPEV